MSVSAFSIFGLQKYGVILPQILHNYTNDLLCLPLVLGAISFVIRRLKNDQNFRFPFIIVLAFALYYSLYFEYYLPQYNPRYTADWIDVSLYFMGACAFYYFEKYFSFRKNQNHLQPND